MKILRAVIILLIIGFIGESVAQTTVLVGLPSEKVQSESGYTERFILSQEQSNHNQCVINKVGNTYLWASRGNAKMQRHQSGVFDIYSATKGQGYVKVERGGKYVEHAHIGLKTITYWGEIKK